jgi:murein DD-endopeptidase MepM/ murein hydrolase activator NlpD
VRVIVPPDQHPRVPRGGNHAADILTVPGEPIFAPAGGKVPHVGADTLDGGTVTSVMFPLDVPPDHKGDETGYVVFVFAHLNRDDRKRTVVAAGDVLGTAAAGFLHIGCNNAAALQAVLAASAG